MEKPDNLISKDEMISLLYDLAVLNAAKSTDANILRDNHIETMEYLYNKYSIDSIQFVRSDAYYASMPEEYEAIYKGVESKLQKEKKKIEKANDSLNLKNTPLKKASKKSNPKDSLP